MNSNFSRVVMTLGLSAVLGSALLVAQGSTAAVAEVPFGFQVAARELPAGTYAVDRMNHDGVFVIRNKETGEAAMALTAPTSSGKYGDPKLVFKHYGDRYFLSQIWLDSATGNTLPPGRLEKEIMGSTTKTPPVLASIALK